MKYKYEVRVDGGSYLFKTEKDAEIYCDKNLKPCEGVSYEFGYASDEDGVGWEFIYSWPKLK